MVAAFVAGLPLALPDAASAQPATQQPATPQPATQPPAPAAAPADPPSLDPLEQYDGRPIRSVDLRQPPPAGAPADAPPAALSPEATQRALNNIRSFPGGAYRAETVRADVDRLNRLGVFRSVEALAQPLDDGSVNLIFILGEQPTIRTVQYAGNKRLTDQQLAGVTPVLEGRPIDRFQIDRAARQIERLYRERGYYRAEVTVDESELASQGIVIFQVREYERVKIQDIRFEGNASFSARLLRRELESKRASLFNRGQVDEELLDQDVSSLIKYYRDNGYLDVRADRLLQVSPNLREAILVFTIDEGSVYTLRDVRVEFQGEGDTVFTDEQIRGLLTIRPGDVYGIKAVEDSMRSIERAYGQLGYVDVSQDRETLTHAELRAADGTPLVDMLIRVRPGERFKTGEVVIAGAELTKQKVIRRHVELLPERPLDTTKLERTEQRLEQLGLFNRLSRDRGVRLTLQQPDPAEPEYRDVLVEVEESNTGSLDLGGAVSADAGFIGRIALTQRNFDVADVPDAPSEFFAGRAFRGAGQRFAIEAQPGDQIETYAISLSEPYLFDTNYSGSAQAFYRTRDFREYDEERFGGRFALGRAFGTRWSGNLTLRVEQVELSNISADGPTDFFDVEDASTIIGLGPRFTRSSLDNIFLPTRGTRTELGAEQVVGDFEFTRLTLEHRVFIPIREDFLDRKTVLSFSTQIGYIPQGQDETPTYERFFLGGESFRGFRFRTISPRGVGSESGLPVNQPVGGTFSFFQNVEIRQPIFEDILAVVGFVDSGTVREEVGFEEYRVSAGVGLRISIPQLSPAPVALDFGFPIVKEFGDENRTFNFSVDVPF